MKTIAAEKNFEGKVKAFLKDQKCWTLKTWSNGIQRSGVPDLLICCNGYFIGAELKAPKGVPSDLQIYNLFKIEESGGIAVLLYPKDFENFKALIIALNSGDLDEGKRICEFFHGQLHIYNLDAELS